MPPDRKRLILMAFGILGLTIGLGAFFYTLGDAIYEFSSEVLPSSGSAKFIRAGDVSKYISSASVSVVGCLLLVASRR